MFLFMKVLSGVSFSERTSTHIQTFKQMHFYELIIFNVLHFQTILLESPTLLLNFIKKIRILLINDSFCIGNSKNQSIFQ